MGVMFERVQNISNRARTCRAVKSVIRLGGDRRSLEDIGDPGSFPRRGTRRGEEEDGNPCLFNKWNDTPSFLLGTGNKG